MLHTANSIADSFVQYDILSSKPGLPLNDDAILPPIVPDRPSLLVVWLITSPISAIALIN